MAFGILAGLLVAAVFSFLLVLKAGMALLWDIMLPGMLLGLIVGFATQRFGGRQPATQTTASVSVSPGHLHK
jgi:hypothetical protein